MLKATKSNVLIFQIKPERLCGRIRTQSDGQKYESVGIPEPASAGIKRKFLIWAKRGRFNYKCAQLGGSNLKMIGTYWSISQWRSSIVFNCSCYKFVKCVKIVQNESQFRYFNTSNSSIAGHRLTIPIDMLVKVVYDCIVHL